jgi:hypothetical protein
MPLIFISSADANEAHRTGKSDEETTMPIFSWLMAMIVALLATSAIVTALPRSAADELSTVAAPQSMFGADFARLGSVFASCAADAD